MRPPRLGGVVPARRREFPLRRPWFIVSVVASPDANRASPPPFEALDFVYTPSRDVAADLDYFTEVLGGRVVFAIEGMGSRVAAVELTYGPPLVLLADHVQDERPILVYRVSNLRAALGELEARGWEGGSTLEIPHGPCCSFRTPGGHRIAVYELARPEVAAHFEGRRDF